MQELCFTHNHFVNYKNSKKRFKEKNECDFYIESRVTPDVPARIFYNKLNYC